MLRLLFSFIQLAQFSSPVFKLGQALREEKWLSREEGYARLRGQRVQGREVKDNRMNWGTAAGIYWGQRILPTRGG